MYSTRAAKHILVSSFIVIVVEPENNCNCDGKVKKNSEKNIAPDHEVLSNFS